MPLILGSHVINAINGPRQMNLLVKNAGADENINNNTIILFGEKHDYGAYSPCMDGEDCLEIQSEFIHFLNEFAATHRTDFYLEEFFKSSKSNEFPNPITDLDIAGMTGYKNRTRDSTFKMLETERTKYIEKYKTFRDSSQQTAPPSYELVTEGKTRSSMVDFDKIYEMCFNKITKNYDLSRTTFYNAAYYNCPYKNIIWQYADVRRTNKYISQFTIENLDLFHQMLVSPKILSLFYLKKGSNTAELNEHVKKLNVEIVDTLLQEDYDETDSSHIFFENSPLFTKKDLESINMYFIRNIAGKQSASLYEVLSMYVNAITTPQSFIEHLLESPIIKKQLNKIDERIRHLFSVESFVQYLNWCKHTNEDAQPFIGDTNLFQELLNLLLEYYNPANDSLTPDEKNALEERVLRDINAMRNFTDHEYSVAKMAYIITDSVTLDIYFILRINKRIPDGNNKLVVGYFGNAHNNGITHYLTEILRSHDLQARYGGIDGTLVGTRQIARVIIPASDTIDVNALVAATATDTATTASASAEDHGGSKRYSNKRKFKRKRTYKIKNRLVRKSKSRKGRKTRKI